MRGDREDGGGKKRVTGEEEDSEGKERERGKR